MLQDRLDSCCMRVTSARTIGTPVFTPPASGFFPHTSAVTQRFTEFTHGIASINTSITITATSTLDITITNTIATTTTEGKPWLS
jgi:hypothetical protein